MDAMDLRQFVAQTLARDPRGSTHEDLRWIGYALIRLAAITRDDVSTIMVTIAGDISSIRENDPWEG